jgi:hypothetical protein
MGWGGGGGYEMGGYLEAGIEDGGELHISVLCRCPEVFVQLFQGRWPLEVADL